MADKASNHPSDLFDIKVQEMLEMERRIRKEPGSGISRYSVRSIDKNGNCIGNCELPVESLPPIASPLPVSKPMEAMPAAAKMPEVMPASKPMEAVPAEAKTPEVMPASKPMEAVPAEAKMPEAVPVAGRSRAPSPSCIDSMPLAMSYTPMQKFQKLYEPAVGFDRGTIFIELDLPFIGEEVRGK